MSKRQRGYGQKRLRSAARGECCKCAACCKRFPERRKEQRDEMAAIRAAFVNLGSWNTATE
jgi:hypothetical protein